MPKLKHPDGHLVSVSNAGRDALLARGYTDPSAPADRSSKPAAADGDLSAMKRADLDEHARKAGVEDPDKLPNKQAVIDAIEARQ